MYVNFLEFLRHELSITLWRQTFFLKIDIKNIHHILGKRKKGSLQMNNAHVKPSAEIFFTITNMQVEFYFSDANITKDKFLLKHVKRNKEGFVSLKLISSFKRVKHLTKDWRQVAHAIKLCSKKLEVNDLETKVRRLEELPPYDETTPSRTVVVLNLPMERPTIEGVAEIFRVCGEIELVRILRPGNPVPADIKLYVNKHPEMTTKVCALVEFERTEFAQKAVRELHNEAEEKMSVMELTATPLKNGNKKIEAKKLAEKAAALAKAAVPQRKHSLQPYYNAPAGMLPAGAAMGPRRKYSLMHNMKFPTLEDMKENVVPKREFPPLNPNAPSFQMVDGHFQMVAPMHHQQPPRGRRSGNPVVYVDDGPQWVAAGPPTSRRVSGQFSFGDAAAAGLKVPANVVRMPKGPEGKGFSSWCKSRMSESKETKRPSKAIPIVAPPPKTVVTLAETPEEEEAAAAEAEAHRPGTSKDHLQV